MVYYYNVSIPDEYGPDQDYTIYLGKDKFENYELVNHSNKSHLWFHVKDLSSAHLYLEYEDFNSVPQELLTIIGQLTKFNSIKGNKLDSVKIIYTPVSNIFNANTSSQDKGIVQFHKENYVKTYNIGKRDTTILNKLAKTKKEVSIDDFIKDQQATLRKTNEKIRLEKERQKKDHLSKKEKKIGYDDMFKDIDASSNLTKNENWDEDEFW